MDETLRQVGGLLLGSVPTILLFVLLYVSYKSLVHNRLQQVLQERHSRTEGAMQKAQADIAAAEGRAAEYEQRLKEAKAELYKAQDARRRQAQEIRSQAIAQSRQQADKMVKEARAVLDKDLSVARGSLEGESEALAQKVIQTVLRPAAAAGSR